MANDDTHYIAINKLIPHVAAAIQEVHAQQGQQGQQVDELADELADELEDLDDRVG